MWLPLMQMFMPSDWQWSTQSWRVIRPLEVQSLDAYQPSGSGSGFTQTRPPNSWLGSLVILAASIDCSTQHMTTTSDCSATHKPSLVRTDTGSVDSGMFAS